VNIPSRLSLACPRAAVCAAALLLLPACQNVPKYKKIKDHFDEWHQYQGRGFKPTVGIDSAVNLSTQTITIVDEEGSRDYIVTPDTQLYHNGDIITLADLPLNQTIKFTFASDHTHLLTVWYGNHANGVLGPASSARHL
jgi:hypothetical protein